MVGNIIVAVACNLVAVMILVSGIFSGLKNGWKVSLVKLFLTAGSFFGSYFLTPVISDAILGITVESTTLGSIVVPNYLSLASVNSVIFTAVFLAFYALTLFICKIINICLINKLKDKKENRVKMIRARSINPKAERMAKRAAKKQLKAQYQQLKNKPLSRFFGCVVGIIISVVVGLVVLMPYGYLADIMNKNGDKEYLEAGFEYTLNGVIPESVFDWAIHNDTKNVPEAPAEPEAPEVSGDAA